MPKQHKILSLVWYKFLPAQFGGQQTIAAFNEALGKQLEILCLCSKNNQASSKESYSIYPQLPIGKLQFVNPFVWLFIYKFCKKERITHAIVEHPYHAISAYILHRFLNIQIVHSSHNIEYQRFRILKKPYWKILYAAEKWISQFAKINIFVTQQDVAIATKVFNISSNKCLVIPHTINAKNIAHKSNAATHIKHLHQIPSNHSIFLFNGTLDYLPNAKAVEAIAHYLITALNKIDTNFTIVVTGRIELEAFQYLYKLQNKQLIVTGFVNEIEQYFLAANVYVNTVQMGGGVQTKTIEALSYHLNVACFSNMLNGIETDLVQNKLFIANENNWTEFAQQVWLATEKFTFTNNSFFEHYNYNTHLQKLITLL